jgi:SAM-dependent methyltransferase
LGESVDFEPALHPKHLVDLSRFPYPFGDQSVDAVYAFSVLEHLPEFFPVMEEIHRILKPTGFVALLVPHFSDAAAYIDPTHRQWFSARVTEYFDPASELGARYGFYSKARFRCRVRLLMLQSPYSRMPFLQQWCNANVATYERLFCFMLRASGVYLELEPQPVTGSS